MKREMYTHNEREIQRDIGEREIETEKQRERKRGTEKERNREGESDKEKWEGEMNRELQRKSQRN